MTTAGKKVMLYVWWDMKEGGAVLSVMKCSTKMKQLIGRTIVIKWKHCTKTCVIGVLLLHDNVRALYELNHSEKCYIWKFYLILLTLLTWLHLIIIFSDHYNIFKRKTIYCEEVKIDIKSYFAVKSENF